MSFDHTVLESSTGAKLALRILPAKGQACGIVQIHHGLSEHGARYKTFAEALSNAGFVVGVSDHRGHGWTRSTDASPGLFADNKGWQKVIEDAQAVERHLKTQFPDLPLIVFGHSMGGVIAINQALSCQGNIDGLAIWNSNLALGSLASLMRTILYLESLFKSVDAPSTWLDAITFKTWGKQVKGGKGGWDWLSRIPEEVKAYGDDPLCGQPATISLWRDLITLNERGENEEIYKSMRKTLPIHLVGGGDDPATQKGKAVKTLANRFHMLQFEDVTLRIDPQARHETLNDIGREQAIEDFINWAKRKLI